MDGVLADFDKRATEILGMPGHAFEDMYGSNEFWKRLQSTPDFYNSFDLMPDGYELYATVRHLHPIVITGVPQGDWAAPQKRDWCHRNFPDMPVICCRSKDKSLHCAPGDVIVDDRTEYRHLWQKKHGVWVHHTDTASSLKVLEAIGII